MRPFVFLGTLVASSFCYSASVPVLRFSGALNPGTGSYLRHGLAAADRMGAPYVVIVLDGAGGLLPTARSVIQGILEAKTPVVAYLGPAGAGLGALGALILAASDIAVMAPGARLGERIEGGGESKAATTRFDSQVGELAEQLARARRRGAQPATKALPSREPVGAEAAMAGGLIDFTAENLAALGSHLLGWQLRSAKGSLSTLPAEEVNFLEIGPSLWQQYLSLVSDSRLAYGLFFLGAILLALQLARPGSVFPLLLGGGCIFFSLFLFYWLPISYGALALLVLGLGFILAEGLVPSYGLFAIAGIGLFLVGSLYLIDTSAPDYQLPLVWVLACAALLAATGFGLSSRVFRGRKLRKVPIHFSAE